MSKTLNIILGGIGGLIVWNVISKYNRLSKNVEIQTLKAPQVDVIWSGLRIRYYGGVKNSTRDRMTLQIPTITLVDKNGNFITQTSTVDAKNYVIQPLNITQLDTKEFTINWSSLYNLGKNLNISMPSNIAQAITLAMDWQNILKQLEVQIQAKMYVDGVWSTQNFPIF